jgi:hypothetical protein
MGGSRRSHGFLTVFHPVDCAASYLEAEWFDIVATPWWEGQSFERSSEWRSQGSSENPMPMGRRVVGAYEGDSARPPPLRVK